MVAVVIFFGQRLDLTLNVVESASMLLYVGGVLFDALERRGTKGQLSVDDSDASL